MSKPRTIKINGRLVKSVKINGQLWWKQVSALVVPYLSNNSFSYCDYTLDMRDYLNYYDSDNIEISGTYTAIESGGYAFYLTPKTGYCWTDGSTDTIEICWEILPREASYITVRYSMQTDDYHESDWDGGSLVSVSGSYWVEASDDYGQLSTSDYIPIENTSGDYSYEGDSIYIEGSYEDIFYSFTITVPAVDDTNPNTVYSEDNGDLIFYK